MESRRNGSAIRLAWQAGGALLAAILVLAVDAGRRFARDHDAFARRRLERLGVLSAEQHRQQEALSAVNRRLAALQADLAVQDERRHLAERAITTLRAGDSWWRTVWAQLFGDPSAVRSREEILAQLEQAQAAAAARGAGLRTTVTRATWERDGAEIALGRTERRLAEAERSRAGVPYYLGRAWLKLRWYLLAALAVWSGGLVLWRRWRRHANP